MSNSTSSEHAILDRDAYPHIFESILSHAPAGSLLKLRLTCHSLRDWADARLAPDLVISYLSSARGVSAVSSSGLVLRFPVPVLPRHTSMATWPLPAETFISRVLLHTRSADLTEAFPPTGLAPLPTFLRSLSTVRIAVSKDGWSEIPRPPDLTGPIFAPEIILLGPTSWGTMPGLRIPHGVKRLVINSPLHSPNVILANVGRPSSLREAVFIFDSRPGLDRQDPDFALKQQHQVLVYSVSAMLAASINLQITLVNLEKLSPMTLGIATAEMNGRSLTETFGERVRLHLARQLGDPGPDRLHFLTWDEYAATRTPKQLVMERGEPLL